MTQHGDTIEASLDTQNGSPYCDSPPGVFIDASNDAGFVPTTHDHLRCGDLAGTAMPVTLVRTVDICHRHMAEAFVGGIDFDAMVDALDSANDVSYPCP